MRDKRGHHRHKEHKHKEHKHKEHKHKEPKHKEHKHKESKHKEPKHKEHKHNFFWFAGARDKWSQKWRSIVMHPIWNKVKSFERRCYWMVLLFVEFAWGLLVSAARLNFEGIKGAHSQTPKQGLKILVLYIACWKSNLLTLFYPWQGSNFFFLNMLWSRHVKPSPAIGEKSERSEIKDVKVCTVWTFPESVWCTIYDPLYKRGWIRTNYVMQRKVLRKKPTKRTHSSPQSISISK